MRAKIETSECSWFRELVFQFNFNISHKLGSYTYYFYTGAKSVDRSGFDVIHLKRHCIKRTFVLNGILEPFFTFSSDNTPRY